MVRIPNLLSEAKSFKELKEAPNYTHFACWTDRTGSLVVDLFIDTPEVFSELCVRYNGIVIAIYNVTDQQCKNYISDLNLTLRGAG